MRFPFQWILPVSAPYSFKHSKGTLFLTWLWLLPLIVLLCAFGAGCWGLRDWAVFARARPATRQVPDVHLSVGPKRLFRPVISVWGGLCCCSCRGSSSPRSGREVSARGRGFAPGSSEEGAHLSGRTRLLASLQTPPRAPEVPGAEVQGSRVPTVLASWLGSGRASRRSWGGVGAEGPQ